jgi:hypothetical protein
MLPSLPFFQPEFKNIHIRKCHEPLTSNVLLLPD